MVTGETQKEQVIKGIVEEQRALLHQLVALIDTLVERNPAAEEACASARVIPNNVFDEIIDTLGKCRGLIKEATEKVQSGIINKVV